MSSKWNAGKKVFEFLAPKPKVKFKGQSTIDEIKKKSQKFKERIADEDFKENFRRYFTNQPPKKPKKKVDKDLF